MSWFYLMAAALIPVQAPSAPPPRLVAVDFMAATSAGDPVADLTVSDVTLKVDGKLRPIQELRFVRLEGARSGEPPAPAPVPYGTNVLLDMGRPARALVIVIEDESLPAGRELAMREAVGMLLASLGPRDRVALVTVPHGGLKVDFTADHERVRQAVWQVTGQADRSESPDEASCRTRSTLQALTGLLDDLAGGEGPTTVLFFSSGLTGISQMVLPPPGQAGQQQPLIGRCVILPEVFEHAGESALRARANFYIAPPESTALSLEGIENLAGVTGGTRLGLSTVAETALARVSRETAGYWVATFSPETSERDGRIHRLEVRVDRPGVVVRARPGIPIATATAELAPGPPVPALDWLRQDRTFRELPLRVAGYVSRQAGDDRLRVIALAEPVGGATPLASLAIGLFDAGGTLVAQWQARGEEVAGRPVQAALLIAPGRYRLRAAASDTFGRRGTADFELDAGLAGTGPLRLSSLVAGLSREGRFLPRLEFGAEASAMVQVEVYGGTPGMRVGAMLDVSDATDGRPLLALPLVVEATSEPDKFIARGTMPLGALPAGDFVVRAVVEVEGQPAVRAVRTIRKQIR